MQNGVQQMCREDSGNGGGGKSLNVRNRHYVIFDSPGTMFAERSSREIGEWSTHLAAGMATEIVERHGARPYCFRFETRREADPIDDGYGGTLDVIPKVINKSGRYFINGRLETLDEVEAKADPDDRIRIANMQGNDWPISVVTTNGYRSTQIFEEDDCIVDADGSITVRGDSAEHVRYRAEIIDRVKQERGY